MSADQQPHTTAKPVPPWKRAHRVWDRGNLAEWRATLSEKRKRKDEKFLTGIFNEATRVPALNDALIWARDHDVEFVVDRTACAGGYAPHGSGIVVIAPPTFLNNLVFKKFWKAAKIDILVHEIRHVWQDYHHMIAHDSDDLASGLISEALIEADAHAHGRLAEKQFNLADKIDRTFLPWKKRSLQHQFELTMNNRNILWENFKAWFPENASMYGKRTLEGFSAMLNLPHKKLPGFNDEFNYVECSPQADSAGIDWTQWSELRRLGKSFTGENYFDSADRDLFSKTFCSSAKALTFFGYADKDDVKLAQEIRKRLLQQKLDRN